MAHLPDRNGDLNDLRAGLSAVICAALAVSAVTLVLYLLTSPHPPRWDTSEYIAAAYTLGIPHPPGNPLFVIIGRVFSILPIASSVAVRINILAAICSAVSAGMWFLITERVLVSWFPERWQRILGGVVAALLGATAFTVWNQSVVNEKVYTVSLIGIAIISWLMIRWSDDPDGRKADRILVLVAYLLGLGYSNHMAGMLAAPAVGLAVIIRRPRTIFRWKLLLACSAMLAGPASNAADSRGDFPAINEGEPTACRTKLEFHAPSPRARSTRSTTTQPRPVRQTRPVRASGDVRRTARHVVDVLQVAGFATRTASIRSRRPCSPPRSSYLGCSAAGCTTSETAGAFGISAR